MVTYTHTWFFHLPNFMLVTWLVGIVESWPFTLLLRNALIFVNLSENYSRSTRREFGCTYCFFFKAFLFESFTDIWAWMDRCAVNPTTTNHKSSNNINHSKSSSSNSNNSNKDFWLLQRIPFQYARLYPTFILATTKSFLLTRPLPSMNWSSLVANHKILYIPFTKLYTKSKKEYIIHSKKRT